MEEIEDEELSNNMKVLRPRINKEKTKELRR